MSLCLLCPGQGSQTPGMFARLASDPLLAPSLARLAPLAGEGMVELAADDSRCFLNRHAQPLVVLYGLVVAEGLLSAAVVPTLVAGYSVGELTAHAVAGALAGEDVLYLAHRRAAAMDGVAPEDCGMLAVRGLALDRLATLAAGVGATIAIENGEDHAVLAGTTTGLGALAQRLSVECGAHVVPLRISVPAHSPLLAAGIEMFAADLADSSWQPYRCPVMAGIDARPVQGVAGAIQSLSHQIAEPILWSRVLDAAVEMGARCLFEIGPGNGLVRMVRERYPDLPARAFDDFSSLAGAVTWLQRHAD
ncbi:MAG: acyltransferase domain-containing protein [Rhodocyclaceae bacterium]